MNTIKIFNVVSNLATTNRYSKSNLAKEESVLEHSGFVTMMSYFIGNEVNKEIPNFINIGELLSKAIVHDIDESITGDIQRTVKYMSKEITKNFEFISKNSCKTISEDIMSDDLIDHWANSKNDKDGAIVALCDTMSVVYKAYNEVCIYGNKGIDFGGTKNLQILIEKRVLKLFNLGFPKNVVNEILLSCSELINKIGEKYEN